MASPVLPDGFNVAASMVLTVAAAAIRVGLDVASSLTPPVAAGASPQRRRGVPEANCCGSGFPNGQDVAASLMPAVVAAA